MIMVIAMHLGKIYISPLGIKIFSNKNLDNIQIKVTYTNDKSEILVDTRNNIGISSSGESEKKENGKYVEGTYTYVFNHLKNISKIKEIYFNGTHLEACS